MVVCGAVLRMHLQHDQNGRRMSCRVSGIARRGGGRVASVATGQASERLFDSVPHRVDKGVFRNILNTVI